MHVRLKFGPKFFLAVWLVVAGVLGGFLWRLGTREFPRIDQLERWRVVLEGASAPVDDMALVLEWNAGKKAGFVLWRSGGREHFKAGVENGITWNSWPTESVINLSKSRDVAQRSVDSLLGLREQMARVSGRRNTIMDTPVYLVYMRSGPSESRFFLDPMANEESRQCVEPIWRAMRGTAGAKASQ